MTAPRIAAAIVFSLFVLAGPTRSAEPQITQAEAEKAAQSVAMFCKILINRMEGLIEDQWATQDLQDLAAVWDNLDCHQVFGVDERVRWLLR